MFDVGFDELLVIVIVAIVVIGPKDLPMALRTVGRWVARMRRVSGHFRSGIETMIREAELEEMEQKWREQNEAIMRAHPALPDLAAPVAEAPSTIAAASAEAGAPPAEGAKAEDSAPQLPLPPP